MPEPALERPCFWLIKSEPDAYSIDDLQRERQTSWDGIRNFSARNHLRQMKCGEHSLFYHSSTRPPGVVGLCRVCQEAYPDPSQHDPSSAYFDTKSDPNDPRWSMVDVEYVDRLPQIVTLDQIKREPSLAPMVLLHQSRLSVQPVTFAQFSRIVTMGGGSLPPSLASRPR